MFQISDLCTLLETYLDKHQVQEVYRAYLLGAEAHKGQIRLSGEPYIYHPLEVARILAQLRLDYKSVIAAILHDVIEDTQTAKEQIAQEFDTEIADLVDGVSKLTQIKFESKAEAQAENFRKLMLAMTKDIRVILIKLADRLHNMRTIGGMRPDKRRRIARETLDIYVPIANRLGINKLRVELQELGFEALYPLRARILRAAIMRARGNRKEIVQKIQSAISERLAQEDLSAQVIGREKHAFSVYQKMRTKHLSFSEVFDVYAFRIVVDKVDTCYRALGTIHNLYKPLPGKFKDYIAIPKKNGYQSLHTVLFGPYGVPIEAQIRTHDMDKVSEAGVAAHWLYKTGEGGTASSHNRANEWLRNLLDMQKNAGNSLEFLENVKVDLFPDVVYVFTPTGDIIELPRGATPVDFAYAVHTSVGDTCIAAKVNRHIAPLRSRLQTGQTVEIVTAPGGKPNPSWLGFVVTGKARAQIRHYLKSLQTGEAAVLGRRLLSQALASHHLTLDEMDPAPIQRVLSVLRIKSPEALFEEIGLGNRIAALVARQIKDEHSCAEVSVAGNGARSRQTKLKNMLTRYAPSWLGGDKDSPTRPLAITGTEGIVVNYAKCCRPIPGDPIIGVFSPGRGMVIHTESCKNIRDFKKHPDKWVGLKWEDSAQGEFPVDIKVAVKNQRGVLATVAAAIAEKDVNIENVTIDDRGDSQTELNFVIHVRSRKHLADIMRRVRTIEAVSKITRGKGASSG